MNMPFGKHKGKPIEQLPTDYLEWIERQGGDFSARDVFDAAMCELKARRSMDEEFMEDFAEEETKKTASAGYQSPTYKCQLCRDTGRRGYIGANVFCSCEQGVYQELTYLRGEAFKTRANTAPPVCRHCKGTGISGQFVLPPQRFCVYCHTGATRLAEYWRSEAIAAQTKAAMGTPPNTGTVNPKSHTVKKAECKEVIAAGRKALAAKYHPDRAPSPDQRKDMEERMKQANVAADWLEACAENRP